MRDGWSIQENADRDQEDTARWHPSSRAVFVPVQQLMCKETTPRSGRWRASPGVKSLMAHRSHMSHGNPSGILPGAPQARQSHSQFPDAIYQPIRGHFRHKHMLPRNIVDIRLLSGYQGNRAEKSTKGQIL